MPEEFCPQVFRAHVVAQNVAHPFLDNDSDELGVVVAGIAAHKNFCAGEAFPELLNQPADVNEAERWPFAAPGAFCTNAGTPLIATKIGRYAMHR